MVRNVLGSLIALAGAAVAVWSPFRAWYNGRLGRAVRIEDVFEGLTRSRADLFGSLLLPMLVAAVLTLLGVLLRSKAVVTLAGLVVLAVTILWMIRQGQTAGGLSVGTAGRGLGPGVGAAVGGGALLLLGALVMSGRRGVRRRGRARRDAYERYDDQRYDDQRYADGGYGDARYADGGYGGDRYDGYDRYGRERYGDPYRTGGYGAEGGGPYGDERYGYGGHEGYGAPGYGGPEGYGPPPGPPYGQAGGPRSDAPTPPQPWGPVAPPPAGGRAGEPPADDAQGRRAPGGHPSDFEDTQSNLPPVAPDRPPPSRDGASTPGPTTAPPPLPPRAGTGATAAEPPRSGRDGARQRLWWGSAHGDDASPTGGSGPDRDAPGAQPDEPAGEASGQREPDGQQEAQGSPARQERRAGGAEPDGPGERAGHGAGDERETRGESGEQEGRDES